MKTLIEKLGLKPGQRFILVHEPDDLRIPFPLDGRETALRGSFDLIIAFNTTQQDLDRDFDNWKAQLGAEGKLWIAWPKAARDASDLNIKSVIRIGYEHGMVESNAIRFDDGWSALKFTHPKAGKTYHNSYGSLNTAAVLHYRK